MKTVLLILLTSVSGWAAFPSSVEGLSVANSHLIAENKGSIYRGSQPIGKEDQLVELGITDVIIFKNETKNEVKEEIKNLKKSGISNIRHIPFRWKDIESEEEQCEMVIEALEAMAEVYQTRGRALYFHCTVGEDRTGMLAGLFRMLVEGKKAEAVFKEEMCGRGYEAGNRGKPAQVVKAIRDELTPTFVKMAAMVDEGKLNLNRLNKRACKGLDDIEIDSKSWRCR